MNNEYLSLTFYYVDNNMTRLVMARAKLDDWGNWHNALEVFTEEGNFSRRKIKGQVFEEWVREEKDQENGQD